MKLYAVRYEFEPQFVKGAGKLTDEVYVAGKNFFDAERNAKTHPLFKLRDVGRILTVKEIDFVPGYRIELVEEETE